MMRRLGAIALAGALLGGLLAIPAGPAGAQNGDSMLDVPRLGFEIDPNIGNVGDTVAAQVDPVDVEEHCATDRQQLTEQLVGYSTAGGGNLYQDPGPQLRAVLDRGPLAGIVVPDEWPRRHPALPPDAPPAGADPLYWTWHIATNLHRALRGGLEGLAAVLLANFLQGAAGTGGSGTTQLIQEAFLDGSFIVTFVDPVTQDLVGELGSFDPTTGLGSVEVPDIEPGLWAVAGACIEPGEVTDESFAAAIQAGTAVLEHYDVPVDANYINFVPEGEAGGQGWLFENVVPAMLAEIVVPRALGIDFYCILNEEGFCATPPDPVGLLTELSEEELAEFADLEAGGGAGDGDAGPAGLAVEPVSASPAFTG